MNHNYLMKKGKKVLNISYERGGFYGCELTKSEQIAILYRLHVQEVKCSRFLTKEPDCFLTPYDEEITEIIENILPAIVYI